jgi:hypothetical protein
MSAFAIAPEGETVKGQADTPRIGRRWKSCTRAFWLLLVSLPCAVSAEIKFTLNIPDVATAAASPAAPPAPVVQAPRKYRVQVSASATFFETTAAVEYVTALSESLPKKIVTVKSKESLNGIILKEYAVGSRYKAVREALKNTIKRINDIESDGDLPVGRIAVPVFPANPSPGDQRYARSGLSYQAVDSVVTANGQRHEYALIADFPAEPKEEVAEFTHDNIELPLDQARQMVENARLNGLDVVDVEGEMTVKLGETACPGKPLHPEVRTNLETAVREMNSLRGARRGLLLIHDSGWPSLPEQQASYRKWFAIFDAIWKKMGSTSPYGRQIPAGPFVASSDTHCATIHQALGDLENFGPDVVDVLYLPLTIEQNAEQLVLELLHLSALLGRLQVPVGRLARPVPAEKIRLAEAEAKAVLPYIPPNWKDREVKTDKALILAPLFVLGAYSSLDPDFRFFVNHSWTVKNFAISALLPEFTAGILVAAAGNETFDVYLKEVQFASRCFNRNDVICVANCEWLVGRHQCSSYVVERETPLSQIGYVGFDGNTGTETGTSFSSPRIGWLLAAADAIRTRPLDKQEWGNWVKRIAISSRKDSGPDKDFLVPTKLVTNVQAPYLKIHEPK